MLGLKGSLRCWFLVLTLSVGLCTCKWQDLFSDFKDVSTALTRKVLPIAQEALFSVDVTSECSGALLRLLSSTRERKAWALKFITSNGMLPMGPLYGTLGAPGHYQQCVTSKSPNEGNNFNGEYCTLLIEPPEEMLAKFFNLTVENGDLAPATRVAREIDIRFLKLRFHFGICIPSTCSAEEMAALISYMTAKYDMGIVVRGCQTLEGESNKHPLFYVAVTLLLILIGLSVFCGVLKGLPQYESVPWNRIFAFQTGFHYLTKSPAAKDRDLAFVGGIRALMAFWVVLGHTYFMNDPQATNTLKESFDTVQTYYGSFVSNGGFLSVSTFFCMSGFMLFHSLVGKTKTHSGFSLYVVAVIRRYVRLTVPSIFVVLMAMALPSIVHGVYKNNFFTMYTDSCTTDWWRVLTYSNTLATLDKMCLFHYWFMSADMQMFVALAPFVLLYVRHPRATIIFWMLCIVFGCAWTIRTTDAEGLPSFGMYSPDWMLFYEFMHLVYTRCAAHLGEFVCGILTALLYHHYPDLKLTPGVKHISLVLTVIAAFSVIEFPMLVYSKVAVPHFIDLFYAGFNRLTWGLVCCWMIFLMATRNLEWLSNLLSKKFFLILGRLAFGTYLVHVPVMLYFMGSGSTPNQFSHMALLRVTFGNWVISIFCAFLLYMLVESPTAQVDTMMWSRQLAATKTKSKSPNGFSMEKKTDPSAGLKEIKVDTPTKL